MSVREANCPSCGASITFASAVTVMVVCPHCGTASVRRDVELEKMGRVADVAPIESALSLGASGKWKGRRFTAIGQVQLDHGKGPWNEWCLSFEDGDIGWLAEAQGETIVTFPRPDIETPLDQPLGVGSKVTLGDETFVVAEAGTARITAARGELPEQIDVGAAYEYFDLRGPNDRYATVALQADGSGETFVGDTVHPSAVVVDESTVTRAGPRRAATDRLGCPSCGSPIVLRDPANTQRVVCSSCGAMTDPRERKLRIIEKAKRLEARPVIPIGAKSRFRGEDFEVLAFLVRSVTADGERYPWEEYLLRRADGAYRWLVSSDGHWTFAEPLHLGDVAHNQNSARWKGETFRHFQGGKAVVDHVQGEVYWEVAIGETVRANDYVNAPRMISLEASDGELVASLGHYVTRAEMAAAFPGVARWPWPRGIAPNQPNPWTEHGRKVWATAGALCAAVVLAMIYFGATHAGRIVAQVQADAPTAAAAAAAAAATPTSPDAPAPAAEEKGVVFSDEFRLESASANVELHLTAGVRNSWLGVDGALVNLDTGDVHGFALAAEQYSGVEDGESWSEGDNEATTYVGSVPAGRYSLRLDAESQAQDSAVTAVSYRLVAKSQVPSTGRGVLLLLALAVPAVAGSLRSLSFEARRWSTSDHAPGG